MPKNKSWSKNSADAAMLQRQILENNYIRKGPKPSEVWRSNPKYQEYKLENFRSNYNRLLQKIREENKTKNEVNELNQLNGEFFCFILIFLST